MSPPTIENKLVMIMAYDKNGVIATDRVPLGSTVTAAYYRKLLQEVLRPKIRQKRFAMFVAGVLILHDNARHHASGAQYRKFWKSMYGKCFPTRHTVLT
jgi:hypothetical protein